MTTEKSDWFDRHPILSTILGIWALLVVIGTVAMLKDSPPLPSSTKQAVSEDPEPFQWDPAIYYDQIQTGQAKADVEQVIGKTSDRCSSTESPGIGVMESCIYGGGLTDKGMLNITYVDGKTYSKTKSSY